MEDQDGEQVLLYEPSSPSAEDDSWADPLAKDAILIEVRSRPDGREETTLRRELEAAERRWAGRKRAESRLSWQANWALPALVHHVKSPAQVRVLLVGRQRIYRIVARRWDRRLQRVLRGLKEAPAS